jgi:hypothetical protein
VADVALEKAVNLVEHASVSKAELLVFLVVAHVDLLGLILLESYS